MDLTLYTYWRSSSAYRVRIALHVKQLPFTSVFVNLLDGEHKKGEYLAKNPSGLVPCLVVDGKPLGESVAILEFLEELAPNPPLYPKDPFARARLRALIETVNSGTQPLQNLQVLKHVSDEQPERAAWAKHFITRGLEAFEARMVQNEAVGLRGPFAFGETISAADCFLVPQVYNAKRFDVDFSAMPRVVRANEAALALDAVKRAMPEAQPDAKA